MTDERKPLAPDRPGRYLLRCGGTITILYSDSDGRWYDPSYQGYWSKRGLHWFASVQDQTMEVVARAPDDAAWCLAQARLLCPEGYAIVPVEPPMEVMAAASYPQAAFIFYREIIMYARNSKWIASAAEGK